jgi:ectoine hydroxylase-related dioxygenase (phytanoyl-CoA dioxygenase family)
MPLFDYYPFEDSNALLSDPNALLRKASQDGYLFFRRALDPEKILTLRSAILQVSKRHGWLLAESETPAALSRPNFSVVDGQSDAWYTHFSDLIQIRNIHELMWNPRLMSIAETLVCDRPLPHSCVICRLVFPNTEAYRKPPHQDIRFVSGHRTWAAWIPVGHCPQVLGGVAILEGSHKFGELPVQRKDWGTAAVPPEGLRWLSSDMMCGDVLFFSNLTVHQSMPNQTDREIRLSVDYRYQPLSEPVQYESMMPYGKCVTWDHVYKSWAEDDPLKYYWRRMNVRLS